MIAEPVLYSFRRCPYAMRARLALLASGTTCELREVKLSAKPDAMLAASPKGTVPVLVLPDGRVIDESIDIMRWALSQRDPDAWFERDDPELIAANDGSFKHDLDRYKYPERHDADALDHRARGLEFLRRLDERLGASSFLSGSQVGLTDAAIVPFVRQFAAVDRDWFTTVDLPRLKTWLADLLASDLFEAIMVRHRPWAPGDDAVWFGTGQD